MLKDPDFIHSAMFYPATEQEIGYSKRAPVMLSFQTVTDTVIMVSSCPLSLSSFLEDLMLVLQQSSDERWTLLFDLWRTKTTVCLGFDGILKVKMFPNVLVLHFFHSSMHRLVFHSWEKEPIDDCQWKLVHQSRGPAWVMAQPLFLWTEKIDTIQSGSKEPGLTSLSLLSTKKTQWVFGNCVLTSNVFVLVKITFYHHMYFKVVIFLVLYGVLITIIYNTYCIAVMLFLVLSYNNMFGNQCWKWCKKRGFLWLQLTFD